MYLKLNDGLVVIEDFAFSCCGLKELEIPSSVISIGKYAFWGNLDLKKVILNEGLISIGNNAFYGCDIEEITIPYGVEFIGKKAFSNNKSLKRVYLYRGSVISKLDRRELEEIFGKNVEIIIKDNDLKNGDIKKKVR